MKFGGPLLLVPLASLFGLRPGMNVAVINSPEHFLEALLPLPEGAALIDASPVGLDVQILFASKKIDLIEKLSASTRGMALTGAIWVCFPSEGDSSLVVTEDFVRLAALEMGLTDTKKILIDPRWAALKLQWKNRVPRPEVPEVRA